MRNCYWKRIKSVIDMRCKTTAGLTSELLGRVAEVPGVWLHHWPVVHQPEVRDIKNVNTTHNIIRHVNTTHNIAHLIHSVNGSLLWRDKCNRSQNLWCTCHIWAFGLKKAKYFLNIPLTIRTNGDPPQISNDGCTISTVKFCYFPLR